MARKELTVRFEEYKRRQMKMPLKWRYRLIEDGKPQRHESKDSVVYRLEAQLASEEGNSGIANRNVQIILEVTAQARKACIQKHPSLEDNGAFKKKAYGYMHNFLCSELRKGRAKNKYTITNIDEKDFVSEVTTEVLDKWKEVEVESKIGFSPN